MMGKKILFVAGVYGVGKTTLCEIISQSFNIPSFSASKLISEKNNEVYGDNKYVKDSNRNQDILIEQVNKINEDSFILNGHFCLKAKNEKIILLEEDVFNRLSLNMILLLSADSYIIKNNLFKRDNVYYDIEYIDNFLRNEDKQADRVSKLYDIPLIKYHMKFDGQDANRVIKLLKNNWKGEN